MKTFAFALRNTKEILRDPLTLFFGLGFPLVLILLLSAIQANIPVALFEIEHLTPGITVFGLSFMTLFSALIVSKDRGSSLLQRLYTSPMTAADFILGYTLPLSPSPWLSALFAILPPSFWGLKSPLISFGLWYSLFPLPFYMWPWACFSAASSMISRLAAFAALF